MTFFWKFRGVQKNGNILKVSRLAKQWKFLKSPGLAKKMESFFESLGLKSLGLKVWGWKFGVESFFESLVTKWKFFKSPGLAKKWHFFESFGVCKKMEIFWKFRGWQKNENFWKVQGWQKKWTLFLKVWGW